MSQVLTYCAASDASQAEFGPETIEAWPAAGGGLLVGIVEPAFAGAASLRRTVKTIFIRIDDSDVIRVTLPYVAIENEARTCIRALVAGELCVSECRIEVGAAEKPTGSRVVIDIDSNGERSLIICAAVARSLLISAAAEIWRLSTELCRVSDAAVFGSGLHIAYRDLAADAALFDTPNSVQLRCGRPGPLVSIRMSTCPDPQVWVG
jgi:hypothetical protein